MTTPVKKSNTEEGKELTHSKVFSSSGSRRLYCCKNITSVNFIKLKNNARQSGAGWDRITFIRMEAEGKLACSYFAKTTRRKVKEEKKKKKGDGNAKTGRTKVEWVLHPDEGNEHTCSNNRAGSASPSREQRRLKKRAYNEVRAIDSDELEKAKAALKRAQEKVDIYSQIVADWDTAIQAVSDAPLAGEEGGDGGAGAAEAAKALNLEGVAVGARLTARTDVLNRYGWCKVKLSDRQRIKLKDWCATIDMCKLVFKSIFNNIGEDAQRQRAKKTTSRAQALFFDNPTGDDDVRWDNVNNETAAGTAARKRMKHLATEYAKKIRESGGPIIEEDGGVLANCIFPISELVKEILLDTLLDAKELVHYRIESTREVRFNQHDGTHWDHPERPKLLCNVTAPALLRSAFVDRNAALESQKQDFHADSARPGSYKFQGLEYGSLAVVFAMPPNLGQQRELNAGTSRLDVDGDEVEIPWGFCVVFRGDVLHRGCAYHHRNDWRSRYNYRLHFYVDDKRMQAANNALRRERNLTYVSARHLRGKSVEQRRKAIYTDPTNVGSQDGWSDNNPNNKVTVLVKEGVCRQYQRQVSDVEASLNAVERPYSKLECAVSS